MELSKQSSKFYLEVFHNYQNMAFGSHLKRLKEEAGISAERLAKVLVVNAERLRKWMSMDLDPREDDRKIIEKFFNMPLQDVEKLKSIRKYLEDAKAYSLESNAKFIVTESQIPYGTNNMDLMELPDGRYIMNTPLIQTKAQAGYLTGWGDPEFVAELPIHPVIVDKVHRGVYRSFEVKGDSMDDNTARAIQDKNILTGRRIERSHWKNKLHLTKFKEYVIVTYKKGIVAKNIIEHDTTEHTITCHSYNPDKEQYPDFKLSLDDVMEIYNIVQITKKR